MKAEKWKKEPRFFGPIFKGTVVFHAAFFKGLQEIELHQKYKWYSQAVFFYWIDNLSNKILEFLLLLKLLLL